MILEQIREFVTGNFYIADLATLGNSDSLLDSGVIDSTGVLEIIAYLEETFNLTIEDSDILPENLDSIQNICNFVTCKMK
jgi:acyl carrier protein